MQCPNNAPCVLCKEVGQLRKLQRGIQERRRACSVKGPLSGFRRPTTRLQWKIYRLLEYCAGNFFKKEHRLLEKDHSASVWYGRRDLVLRLPALQLLPFGLLHVVGIDGTRRQQQWTEEALQLVVCGLWRPMRMESAQQDTGGADWCHCQ